MSAPKGFCIKARCKSFVYAFRGVAILLKTQHNTWIHLAATIAALSAATYFDITEPEWCSIIFAITLVWFAEAINTAIEFLADAAVPKYNELVGKAKDVAAAAVLFTCVGAAVVGVIVFGPCVAEIWNR